MPSPTRRLYRDDSYMTRFHASVVDARQEGKGLASIVLDQTAFYPTGGGQPFDAGTLGGGRVVNVKEGEGGRILHTIECPDPPAGEIEGMIDWTRRFDHMQQHTGQHILSRALVELAGAATRSFHLGSSSCTIDIDLPESATSRLREAERLANSIVFANQPVTIEALAAEEAGRIADDMDLVRELALKPGDPVRLISVGEFDKTPCGGTHVSRSGEVGCIAIRGWERFKGGTRVTFFCGGRAVEAIRGLSGIVDDCVSRLSVRPEEIPSALDRLREETRQAHKTNRTLSEALAGAEAVALDAAARVAGSVRVVVELFEQRDIEQVQMLARKITASPGRIALLSSFDRTSNRAALVFARSDTGADTALGMGDLMASVCTSLGGKGGGNPSLARGGGIAADQAGPALEEAFDLIRRRVGA